MNARQIHKIAKPAWERHPRTMPRQARLEHNCIAALVLFLGNNDYIDGIAEVMKRDIDGRGTIHWAVGLHDECWNEDDARRNVYTAPTLLEALVAAAMSLPGAPHDPHPERG